MKNIFYLMLVIVATHAQANDATGWKAAIKVVDDAKQPVKDAQVTIFYDVPRQLREQDSGKIVGLTDTNGAFTASHYGRTFGFRFVVGKNGYYSDNLFNDFHGVLSYKNLNPNLTFILRKIASPIAMYAKREETKFQQVDKPMGFDLEAGDWVTPYGEGFHTDMIFTLVHRQITGRLKYDCYLTITFPNQGDGIVVAPPINITGSEFKTSRTATENGYEPELDLHYSNTNQPPSVFGYFIRVRTELNPDGTVKSALYGKIAGNFRFYAGTIKPTSGMGFTYYLNPTANDRNVEFNPGKNLIKDLRFDESVKEP